MNFHETILNWINFWIEFSWYNFELNIELNQFWAKFKHWIESIWVSNRAIQLTFPDFPWTFLFSPVFCNFPPFLLPFAYFRRKDSNLCHSFQVSRSDLIYFSGVLNHRICFTEKIYVLFIYLSNTGVRVLKRNPVYKYQKLAKSTIGFW